MSQDVLPLVDEDAIDLDAVKPGVSKELKRLLTLFAAAAAVFALFYFTPAGTIVADVQNLRAYLKGDDLWAELAFAAIVAGLVAIGMPRLIFYGVGGLAFGFWQGLLLAQLGSLAGAFATFYAIRHGGRNWLIERFGEHRYVGKAFRVRSSIKAVALIRQLPLHGLMITGGLALSEVTPRAFLAGTFIGFLPQGIITALIGSGVFDEQSLQGLSKLLVAAVVLFLGLALLRRRGNRS